jgi:hypothetical protein
MATLGKSQMNRALTASDASRPRIGAMLPPHPPCSARDLLVRVVTHRHASRLVSKTTPRALKDAVPSMLPDRADAVHAPRHGTGRHDSSSLCLADEQ